MSEVVDPRKPAPEKGKAPAETAAAPQEMPLEVELTHHGKKMKVPMAKAIELANAGYGATRRHEELKAKEAALQSSTEDYARFQKLQEHLSKDPEAAQAVALALKNPKAVLRPAPTNGANGDDLGLDDEPAPQAGRRNGRDATTEELAALRQEIAELKNFRTGLTQEREATVLEASLSVQLEAYPWLKGKPRAVQEAREKALRLVTGRGLSVEAAASNAANDYRELLEEEARAKLDAASQPAPRVSGPPAGPAATYEMPKLGRKDLGTPRARGIAMELARRFFPNLK